MNVFQNLPLNKAHLNERKAEQCLLENDKEGAAIHYELASNCINEAMKQKYAVNISFSLSLQNDNYIKCKKKCEQNEKQINFNDATKLPSTSNKNIGTLLDVADKDNHNKAKDNLCKPTINILCNGYHEQEPDSMLRAVHTPVANIFEKKPRHLKSDKDVIEELKTKNTALQSLVDKLSLEKEELKCKFDELKEENKELQKQLARFSILPEKFYSFQEHDYFQFDKST